MYSPIGVHQVYTFLPPLYITLESVHLRTVFRAEGVQKVYTFLPDLRSASRGKTRKF